MTGAIDWQCEDDIVLMDLEFPANGFAALRLRAQHGVEVRVVRAPTGRPDRIASAVDSRTRLVIASAVSHHRGYRFDLDVLADIVHAAGALLLVDATQAAGAIRVSGRRADFVVAATYKWLLRAHALPSYVSMSGMPPSPRRTSAGRA